MQVHDVIADVLAGQGQQHLFGVEGAGRAGHVRVFGERFGAFVSTVDTAAAVAMADGFARASGRVSVTAVGPGSGLVSSLVPLVEAARSRTPLVVLCESLPPELWLAGAGIGHDRVHLVGSVVRDLNRAFQRAVGEERPVVVEVPPDLLDAEAGDQPPVVRPVPAGPRDATAESLDAALGLIASAQRPVVLAGWGAVRSGAATELVELAERIGGVLATTLRAKGLFRGHARDLGVFGRLSNDTASQVISEADCVITFGASLNQFTTLWGSLVKGKRIVHVDEDPTHFGLTTPVTEAVAADARLTARAMNAALDDAGHTPASQWAEKVEETLAESGTPPGAAEPNAALDVASAMRALDDMLSANRTLVTDLGPFLMDAWTALGVSHPSRLINMNAAGFPGLGLAGAVGVSIARPEEVTLVVLEGNAFISAPGALTTAVAESTPVLAAVCNRGNADVALVAEGLGGDSATVHDRAELEGLRPRLEDLDGPMVLDLRLPTGT